ncbi:flagellar biosynthetic protein FliO [Hyphobacterium sp. HN65]|uniref:Flagellar biosynthetic protein FliO n=1 Tax=Hyphobacterium lacteum TaxID=3116575 RepID=A0ABU7LQJ6_9PROT|nr:flagellar biosynthetic protein FliO [Hyphobacterium sp. HN65]MEE2526180.1 flagellar biosynthetic protein FliO [Hyphobacterium sp. HN65]
MDVVDAARYIAALAVVLGLLGLFALGARQGWLTGLIAGLARGQVGGIKRERRMKVVETLVLDPRRRIVIVEIDGQEQRLLLGASGETVLPDSKETGL